MRRGSISDCRQINVWILLLSIFVCWIATEKIQCFSLSIRLPQRRSSPPFDFFATRATVQTVKSRTKQQKQQKRLQPSSGVLYATALPPEKGGDPSTGRAKPTTQHLNRNYTKDTLPLYNQFFNSMLRFLAELSLEDYHWRTNLFKSKQAERMLEESIARMQGLNATYVRPMDAPSRGPLGQWERQSVEFLFSVIHEEGHRARKIVQSAGRLIRPSDNRIDDNCGFENDNDECLPLLGPLGELEQRVVQYFARIRAEEEERIRTKTLRPKDLGHRGPLGQLEWEMVRTFDEIRASETLRAQQSRLRGGEIVRPIDVPGPLGEIELKVAEVFQAEQRRARERIEIGGQLVRPKDASVRGPLGDAEMSAYEAIQSLSKEEMERLRNIRMVLQERRPMEVNRASWLGVLEALVVGIIRAPKMLISVVVRVAELLQSQYLDSDDMESIRKLTANAAAEENSKKYQRNRHVR